MVKGRLWFHLGRLEAEEDALTLKLEALNTDETLKFHGFGLPQPPRHGTLIATSWCSPKKHDDKNPCHIVDIHTPHHGK